METNSLESWIKEEAVKFANAPHYSDGSTYSVSPKLYLNKGFTAGANLLLPEIKLRDERIEELEKNIDWRGKLKSLTIGLNAREKQIAALQSENEILKKRLSNFSETIEELRKRESEIERLKEENEKLKRLIEKAHDAGYDSYEKYSKTLSWLGFKTDNL